MTPKQLFIRNAITFAFILFVMLVISVIGLTQSGGFHVFAIVSLVCTIIATIAGAVIFYVQYRQIP